MKTKEDVVNCRVEGSGNFGYPDPKTPCCICGAFNKNQSEPRFGYTVCIMHQHITPVETNRFRL